MRLLSSKRLFVFVLGATVGASVILPSGAALAQGQGSVTDARTDANSEKDRLGVHFRQGLSVLSEKVRQERLFAVDFDGKYGAAVGEFGIVEISEDGGQTWKTDQAPTDLALLGVAVSRGTLLAVGQQGLILLRDASGNWQEIESGTQERLLEVAVGSGGRAVTVGAFGTLRVSNDGGRNWRNAAPDWVEVAAVADIEDRTGAATAPTMFAAEVLNDGTLFVGGELAYILRSDNDGQSWSVVNHGRGGEGEVPPTLHSLVLREDGVGFAVGQEGQVFKTSDEGMNWSPRPTPIQKGNLLAVNSTRQGVVMAVGMRLAVYSDDDGETWFAANAGDFMTHWYSDIIAANNGNRLIAVGHQGRIIALE